MICLVIVLDIVREDIFHIVKHVLWWIPKNNFSHNFNKEIVVSVHETNTWNKNPRTKEEVAKSQRNGAFEDDVYSRRWMVLGISVSTAALRAYIGACFDNINDVFARFFKKTSEEVDWFMLVQSAHLILGTLPMSQRGVQTFVPTCTLLRPPFPADIS